MVTEVAVTEVVGVSASGSAAKKLCVIDSKKINSVITTLVIIFSRRKIKCIEFAQESYEDSLCLKETLCSKEKYI